MEDEETWAGDKPLGTLNSGLDGTRDDSPQRAKHEEVMDSIEDNKSDTSGPGFPFEGHNKADMQRNQSESVYLDQGRAPLPTPMSLREPSYVDIAGSAENETLLEDTQRWMNTLEETNPLPTQEQLLAKGKRSASDNENSVEDHEHQTPPPTNFVETLPPLSCSGTAGKQLPIETQCSMEEVVDDAPSIGDFNLSIPLGYIMDPIFGNVRPRTKLDDFRDSPRRLWDMWRYKPLILRRRRIPRGYRDGHSGLKYKEWLKDKGEDVSSEEDASSEDSLSEVALREDTDGSD
jgi:hypothetical protein